MKKHIPLFFISALLMVSLNACSFTKDKTTPTPVSTPVVVENTPSQDITENAPENDGFSIDLKQQELEKDPNITKGFAVAGSCTYDAKSAFGNKICIDVSDDTVKDDCSAGGGQWQKTACDEKLYQEKCKDFFEISDKNGIVTKKVYQNQYSLSGSTMGCAGIKEILKK